MEKEAIIKESVIMPGCVIGKNVRIESAVVAPGMIVADGSLLRPEKDYEEVILDY